MMLLNLACLDSDYGCHMKHFIVVFKKGSMWYITYLRITYLFNSLRKSTYYYLGIWIYSKTLEVCIRRYIFRSKKEHFRVDFIADLIFLRWLGVLILFQTEEVKDPSRDP